MKFSSRVFSSFLLRQFVNRTLLVQHCSLPTTSSTAKFCSIKKGGDLPEGISISLAYRELYEKRQKYRQAVKKVRGTAEHAPIEEQLAKLNEELVAIEKLKRNPPEGEMSISTLILAPSQITLEVISNGTTHMGPSVIVRTPLRCYLFNCPEGTGRFISTFRIRSVAINDIFATKANWDNTGGIASVLMDKVGSKESLRLHGPPKIASFLEMQRPYLDLDFGHTNYPVLCEEWSYEREHFEDSILHVRYIPLFETQQLQKQFSPSSSPSTSRPNSPSTTNGMAQQQNQDDTNADDKANAKTVDQDKNLQKKRVDVAYLVQVKDSLPNIDPMKLLQLKIPRGPHIAQLKAGIPITLEDGREIQPTDVYSDAFKIQQPNLLFVEVTSSEKLGYIHANALLKDFMGDERLHQMSYIVHFTRQRLLDSTDYRIWMRAFGPKCSHLVVNGTGPPMTMNDGIYRAQLLNHHIFPQAFPQIFPPPEHYDGKQFTQNIECDESLAQHPPTSDGVGPIFIGSTFLRFPIRGRLPKFPADDSNMMSLDFTVNELNFRTESIPKLPSTLKEFKKTLDAALAVRGVPDVYPQVFFIGTASAVAAKYRNVSSYLLQLSPTSAVMIDCGEGTYGQMRILFGPKHCAKMLTHLNALFFTHAHLDHTNGVFTIVQERIKAFTELGLPYRPLLLVSNYIIRKTLTTFALSYINLSRYLKFVDIPFLLQKDSVRIHPRAVSHVSSPGAVTELTKFFPRPLFSPKEWNLGSAKGVQVKHTRSSSGFVFECEDSGRRVVFSGDTKPCELLEEHGREAEILIHEATFEDGMENDALRKRHSTMRQAFDSAQRMHAKHVFLTHFSTRYARVPPLPDYLLNAGNFAVAFDNMMVPFDLRHVFPKMLPLFREMFKEELFTNQVKAMKRRLEHHQDESGQQQRQQQNPRQ